MKGTTREKSTLVVRLAAVWLAALGLSGAFPACAQANDSTAAVPPASSRIFHRTFHDCRIAGVPCGKQRPGAPGNDLRLDNPDGYAMDIARIAMPTYPIVSCPGFQHRVEAPPPAEPPIYVKNCAYLE